MKKSVGASYAVTGGANCGAEILDRCLDNWYVGEETKGAMDLRCVSIRLVNLGRAYGRGVHSAEQ